jgi:hypothetical protein
MGPLKLNPEVHVHGNTSTLPQADPLVRALDRATSERVVVYRIDSETLGVASVVDGVWTAKPYRLAILGSRPQDLACNCLAGQHARTCKHLAAGIFARQNRVYAVQPAVQAATPKTVPATCPACGMAKADPMYEVFCDA